MIGKRVTVVRERPDMHRTFTTTGVVTDVTKDANGRVSGVAVLGDTDGRPCDSWFAVGPDGLDGSLVTEQRCTVDACGHEIYSCPCL